MEVAVDQSRVSDDERAQINNRVKAELVEHLYQGCLPGTITGIPVGIAFFVDFYKYSPTALLISWYVYYNLALLVMTALYFFYVKNKNKYSYDTWLNAYAVSMSSCALAWGMCVYLIPDNVARQYFAFIALFVLGTGYSTGSIGIFKLCVITQAIIVVPLATWCFLKGGTVYNLVGIFAIMYMGFMLSINRRSTVWFIDSLKLKLENTLVSYQANHDLLTDLPNQRLLPRYIESAIKLVENTGNTFALVCFSLNRMEIINDSFGPQAGDTVIQSIAHRLKDLAATKAKENAMQYIVSISRKDTFNILMVPIKEDQITKHVNELFSLLDDTIYLETRGVKLTASIGISIFGKDGNNVQAMLTGADAAMLEAKQFGGNRMEYYRAEINAQHPKQLELENDLHSALKNKQLHVYYQPLIDLKSGQICGMEALLRWVHPVHGFISPAHFIPIAEETGLIVPIGEWVLQEACMKTKEWQQMGFNHLRVAVNLAEKQLRNENLISSIKHILQETKLDAAFLELEITETAILDDAVTSIIKEFNSMGLSLAVDDFGTGYSGLSYLKRFSIDKLKIDQSFIRDIPGNAESMTIVSAIIAMSKELDIKALAEGVETEEQLQFLKSKGCDYIQGYYYSKPIDANSFTQYLKDHLPVVLIPNA